MKKLFFGAAAPAILLLMATGLALAGQFTLGNVGPAADVAAVRAAELTRMTNTTILGVHVVGDFALVIWSQTHICCPSAAFKRFSGEKWKFFAGSAGDSPLDPASVVNAGVPATTALKICQGWSKGYQPCQTADGKIIY